VGLAQDVEMGAYFAAAVQPMANMPLASMSFDSGNFSLKQVSAAPRNGRLHEAVFVEERGSSGEDDVLVNLAASLEPDGGIPGASEDERVQATILVLLRFMAAGHSAKRGAFRAHIKRMLKFLERSAIKNGVIKDVIERAKTGRPLAGDWAKSKPGPDLWAELEKAIAD
jgi:hypothetical protein